MRTRGYQPSRACFFISHHPKGATAAANLPTRGSVTMNKRKGRGGKDSQQLPLQSGSSDAPVTLKCVPAAPRSGARRGGAASAGAARPLGRLGCSRCHRSGWGRGAARLEGLRVTCGKASCPCCDRRPGQRAHAGLSHLDSGRQGNTAHRDARPRMHKDISRELVAIHVVFRWQLQPYCR